MTTIVANPTTQGEVWHGDFADIAGPLAQNQYPLGQQIYETSSRFQIYGPGSANGAGPKSPPPGLSRYAQLNVLDGDLSGDPNPRCQIQSPFVSQPNQIQKASGWFLLDYVPPVTGSEFFNINEWYGPPFAQSPNISLTVDKFGNIAVASYQAATAPHFFNGMWTTPLAPLLGVWCHFSYKALMSADNTVGWLEFSFAGDGTDNDVLQTLTINSTSTTHMPMQTMDFNPANGQPGTHAAIYPQLYRSRGLEASSVIYHAGYRVDV